jgi:hypothetical protein
VNPSAPRAWLREVARLVVFDLHRHRGTAILLVALEIVRAVLVEGSLRLVPAMELAAPDSSRILASVWRGGIGLYDSMLWLATLIALATLVQGDHPAQDRAFWRTRPIAPATLAAAKLAAAGLLCVIVPALVNAMRLAAYGAPLAAQGASVVQIAVLAGFTLLPAWPVALATGTLPRFFAGALLVLVATFYLVMAVGPPHVYHPIHDGWRHGAPLPVFDWRRHDLLGWWTSLAFVGAGGVIVIGHYAMRRALVTVPAGAALLAATIAWPIGAAPSAASPELARLVANQLRVDAIDGVPPSALDQAHTSGDRVHVAGPVLLPGLPAGLAARIALGPTAIDTGTRGVVATGLTQCCRGNGPATLFPVVPSTAGGGFPYIYNRSLFTVDAADASALGVPRLDLRAPVTIDLTQHLVAGSMPVRVGASLRTDRYLLEIQASTFWVYQRLVVRLARFPTLTKGDEPQIWLLWTDADGRVGHYARSDWWTTDGEWREGFERPGWANGRAWVDRFTFDLGWRNSPRPARLVVIEARDAGRVTTTLIARDVVVTPPRYQ